MTDVAKCIGFEPGPSGPVPCPRRDRCFHYQMPPGKRQKYMTPPAGYRLDCPDYLIDLRRAHEADH